MRFQRNSPLARRFRDAGALCVVGLSISAAIGFLQDPTPFGDDAIYYIGTVKALTSNFPFLAWDPHVFAGYMPAIGLSWLTFLAPFVLARIGLDAISSFHLSFVAVFLLFGLAVYYSARSVGSGRLVSFSMSILAWSTNAYWNNTIWGGAYNRAFTIPFLFLAMGATYRYAGCMNAAKAQGSNYWLGVAAWTLAYVGDIFVAIAGAALGLAFLLLSAGRRSIVTGLKRVVSILVPGLGLSLWQLVPILQQAVAVEPFRNQYTGPNVWTSLFFPGSTWVSTLNYVYVPLVLLLAVACVLTKARVSLTQSALLVSLSVMGAYWFVMGWLPSLWPYLPRLMATDSSIENLAWIFLIALPLLFAILRKRINSSGRVLLRIRAGLQFSLGSRRLVTILTAFVLLFVISDALVVLPAVKPVSWWPLSEQLNTALNGVMGPASSDYRVSLENRFLTRTFLFYQPDRFDTGGRVENLDPNPFFNNWYATSVFYKNDLGSIRENYIEDRPTANVSSLLESAYNFAGEKFWLDWFAVNGVVFYSYAFRQTIGNYSARSSLFHVVSTLTDSSVTEVIAKPVSPSAILVATNASIIGFYSEAANSQDEYRSLISILSDLGLNSRFIIPLYLQSIRDVLGSPINLLVTDSYTYSRQDLALQPLFETSDIAVVSSTDGNLGLSATIHHQGSRLLFDVPISFPQLVDSREAGAYYFVRSTQVIPIDSFNASASAYYAASATVLSPSSWAATYKTSNVQGSLQSRPNALILNVTSSDTSKPSQFNVQSFLPDLVPLSKDLVLKFSVQTTANVTLGISFGSAREYGQNYVAIDQKVNTGDWVNFQVPFSQFIKWHNSSAVFGVARDLTFAVNLPWGNPNVILQIANVSLASAAYTISKFPEPLSASSDGVLEYDTRATGVGLLNESNSSTAILALSNDKSNGLTTLASLSGGQENEQFDEIITVGGNGPIAPIVDLFSQSPTTAVHEEWTNNENMIAQSVPRGFHGLVWKETYSQSWRIGSETGTTGSQLNYYYAGPGMIYIPMANYTARINASYVSESFQPIALFSTSLITIAALVIMRNRLPAFGIRKHGSPEEVAKH